METFTITSTYKVLKDGQTEVCLKPASALIADYIASYRSFIDETTAIAETPDFIIELTPLMFAEFQAMDSVPQSIRDQYTL